MLKTLKYFLMLGSLENLARYFDYAMHSKNKPSIKNDSGINLTIITANVHNNQILNRIGSEITKFQN